MKGLKTLSPEWSEEAAAQEYKITVNGSTILNSPEKVRVGDKVIWTVTGVDPYSVDIKFFDSKGDPLPENQVFGTPEESKGLNGFTFTGASVKDLEEERFFYEVTAKATTLTTSAALPVGTADGVEREGDELVTTERTEIMVDGNGPPPGKYVPKHPWSRKKLSGRS